MKTLIRILRGAVYLSSLTVLTLFLVSFSYRLEQIDKNLTPRQAMQICNNIKGGLDSVAKRIKCVYSSSTAINAHANNTKGEIVVIYKGMIDFVNSADELAVVIGHEIAHHMLGHLDLSKYHGIKHYGYKTRSMYLKPQYREAMADMLGMKLAELAGYDACKGKDLWTRMVKLQGHSYFGNATHPHKLARIYNFDKQCKL